MEVKDKQAHEYLSRNWEDAENDVQYPQELSGGRKRDHSNLRARLRTWNDQSSNGLACEVLVGVL